MKKITKNIFLSLALLACGVTPLATSLSLGVNRDIIANTNESQVVDNNNILENDPTSDDDTGDSGESQVTTYTYKSYLDYFIDNMDCTGIYDTDGNLTNVTISAEKKAEILSCDFTGNGTISDPYQVNTTQGFWYMSKFVNLTSKYVELNCDVVLNDEKFDENGNASGGDGVVYNWSSIKNVKDLCFDGEFHVFSGLFINDENLNYASIFGASGQRALSVSNVVLKNIYMDCNSYFGSICYSVENMENCRLESGVIRGKYAYGGLCYSVKNIGNCVNKATLYVSSGVGGITYYINGKAVYCENYGNINAASSAGGIAVTLVAGAEISNCKNYGNLLNNEANSVGGLIFNCSKGIVENCENFGRIYGNDKIGGIMALISQGDLKNGQLYVLNCRNYGDTLSTTTTRGWSCGGIVGVAMMKFGVIIDGCENYGNFKRTFSNDTCACVIGQIGGTGGGLTITNCHLEIDRSKSSYAIFTNHTSAAGLDIKIYNNVVKIKNATDNIYFSGFLSVNNYEVKDCIIYVEGINQTTSFLIRPNNLYHGNIYIKNIIVSCEVGNLKWDVPSVKSDSSWYQNGILIFGQDENAYIGSNFRDFYVSWKYGTIGLKTLDGVGSAQGSITTDWLDKNGWVKKG